jgi:hypothetical protein
MDKPLDIDLKDHEVEENQAREQLAGRRKGNERLDQKITSELTAINWGRDNLRETLENELKGMAGTVATFERTIVELKGLNDVADYVAP